MIDDHDPLNTVVVIGGGIIGLSTAYYLTKSVPRPNRILLLEKETIACAASGKAGGFIAREWGNGPTIRLHEVGYDLLRVVAEQLDIKSYREIEAGCLSLGPHGPDKKEVNVKWKGPDICVSCIPGKAAQITPREYADKLAGALRQAHVEIFEGVAVDGLERHGAVGEKGPVIGVVAIENGKPQFIECDAVVVCCGPWTGVLLEQWFDNENLKLPIEGIESSSYVYDSNLKMTNDLQSKPLSLFCSSNSNSHGARLEIIPRPDGSVYISGLGNSKVVGTRMLSPGGECDSACKIKGDKSRIEATLESLKNLMSALPSKEPDVIQACMRPCATDGLPCTGSLAAIRAPNVFVSTGHNCWGINWSLVSGRAMADLILHGESPHLNLDAFDPMRFTKKKGRGRHANLTPLGEQW